MRILEKHFILIILAIILIVEISVLRSVTSIGLIAGYGFGLFIKSVIGVE
jgi:hypothetical protein